MCLHWKNLVCKAGFSIITGAVVITWYLLQFSACRKVEESGKLKEVSPRGEKLDEISVGKGLVVSFQTMGFFWFVYPLSNGGSNEQISLALHSSSFNLFYHPKNT